MGKQYGDGEPVAMGDTVEVNEDPDLFEPEAATVIKIGREKIRVEFVSEFIKPRRIWVMATDCELISREY
jgi:transcription antitermination factor NusG